MISDAYYLQKISKDQRDSLLSPIIFMIILARNYEIVSYAQSGVGSGTYDDDFLRGYNIWKKIDSNDHNKSNFYKKSLMVQFNISPVFVIILRKYNSSIVKELRDKHGEYLDNVTNYRIAENILPKYLDLVLQNNVEKLRAIFAHGCEGNICEPIQASVENRQYIWFYSVMKNRLAKISIKNETSFLNAGEPNPFTCYSLSSYEGSKLGVSFTIKLPKSFQPSDDIKEKQETRRFTYKVFEDVPSLILELLEEDSEREILICGIRKILGVDDEYLALPRINRLIVFYRKSPDELQKYVDESIVKKIEDFLKLSIAIVKSLKTPHQYCNGIRLVYSQNCKIKDVLKFGESIAIKLHGTMGFDSISEIVAKSQIKYMYGRTIDQETSTIIEFKKKRYAEDLINSPKINFIDLDMLRIFNEQHHDLWRFWNITFKFYQSREHPAYTPFYILCPNYSAYKQAFERIGIRYMLSQNYTADSADNETNVDFPICMFDKFEDYQYINSQEGGGCRVEDLIKALYSSERLAFREKSSAYDAHYNSAYFIIVTYYSPYCITSIVNHLKDCLLKDIDHTALFRLQENEERESFEFGTGLTDFVKQFRATFPSFRHYPRFQNYFNRRWFPVVMTASTTDTNEYVSNFVNTKTCYPDLIKDEAFPNYMKFAQIDLSRLEERHCHRFVYESMREKIEERLLSVASASFIPKIRSGRKYAQINRVPKVVLTLYSNIEDKEALSVLKEMQDLMSPQILSDKILVSSLFSMYKPEDLEEICIRMSTVECLFRSYSPSKEILIFTMRIEDHFDTINEFVKEAKLNLPQTNEIDDIVQSKNDNSLLSSNFLDEDSELDLYHKPLNMTSKVDYCMLVVCGHRFDRKVLEQHIENTISKFDPFQHCSDFEIVTEEIMNKTKNIVVHCPKKGCSGYLLIDEIRMLSRNQQFFNFMKLTLITFLIRRQNLYRLCSRSHCFNIVERLDNHITRIRCELCNSEFNFMRETGLVKIKKLLPLSSKVVERNHNDSCSAIDINENDFDTIPFDDDSEEIESALLHKLD